VREKKRKKKIERKSAPCKNNRCIRIYSIRKRPHKERRKPRKRFEMLQSAVKTLAHDSLQGSNFRYPAKLATKFVKYRYKRFISKRYREILYSKDSNDEIHVLLYKDRADMPWTLQCLPVAFLSPETKKAISLIPPLYEMCTHLIG
jgi:hypothetical protein